jgi:hypothetical protein
MSAALLNSGTVGVEEAVELDERELVGLAVVGAPSAPQVSLLTKTIKDFTRILQRFFHR